MDTEQVCPICQEEFNPEINERIPYKFCHESHFLCKGCIRDYIQSLSFPGEIQDMTDQNFRGFKLKCPGSVQVHCPVCRCSIHSEYRTAYANTQIFGFSRDRIFDQMISSKSSIEPSMALKERHKVKTQLDKTHCDFVTFMQSSLNLDPMYQNLKKLNEDYERLMSSQEQSVQEFDSKIGQKVNDLKKLESDVKEQDRVLKQLIKQEPLLKAEYKRQEIAESKRQIQATVNKYEEDIISKYEADMVLLNERHERNIVLLKERHQELIVEISTRNENKINEIDCYKAGLRFQKKQILDTYIRDNSPVAKRLMFQKNTLVNKINELEKVIKDYEIHISKLCSDADHVLKTAMKKNGFDDDYLSHEQKKYEREAAQLRTMLIEQAIKESKAEKDKMRMEVYETKQVIDQQIKEWRTSRKEFKKFIALKNSLGEQRAEIAFSPLSRCNQKEVETTFWKFLAEYENIPNPAYKLSEYHHWKGHKKRTGDCVEEFLMKQRIKYGFN